MNKPLAILLVALPLCTAGCGHQQREAHRVDTRERTSPTIVDGGRLVDVGGRRLYMTCTGTGSPTVILEAGFGGSSTDWRDVQPQLGRTARTCAYDRAGLGSSVARSGVHDARDENRDLQQLLFSAGLRPPYVLVGHSYGGLLTRLYAHQHPREVAGVVLVDALGRDAQRRELAIWPPAVDPEDRAALAEPVVDGVDMQSGERLDDGVRSLGDVPLVVIEAGRHDAIFGGLPPALRRAQERLWSRSQAELAGLSSDHALVRAERADHFVQRLDGQPRVVVRAVQAVVRAARTGARLEHCARAFRLPAVRCLSG
jgi:pimeloyl-ACP methyl ester carboxylesterase